MTLGTSQEKFEIFSEESKKSIRVDKKIKSMNGNTTKKIPMARGSTIGIIIEVLTYYI